MGGRVHLVFGPLATHSLLLRGGQAGGGGACTYVQMMGTWR